MLHAVAIGSVHRCFIGILGDHAPCVWGPKHLSRRRGNGPEVYRRDHSDHFQVNINRSEASVTSRRQALGFHRHIRYPCAVHFGVRSIHHIGGSRLWGACVLCTLGSKPSRSGSQIHAPPRTKLAAHLAHLFADPGFGFQPSGNPGFGFQPSAIQGSDSSRLEIQGSPPGRSGRFFASRWTKREP